MSPPSYHPKTFRHLNNPGGIAKYVVPGTAFVWSEGLYFVDYDNKDSITVVIEVIMFR